MRFIKLLLLFIILFPISILAQENETVDIERCINMGNMLEAPNEGDWGLRIEEDYFSTIAEAGFDTVRIPIRWSNHADDEAPYTIDDDFMVRVHEVVNWSLEAELVTMINVHHYEAMMDNPEDELERLAALWQQIADSFADYPDTVIFELLNEPNNNLDYSLWNDIYLDLIDIIRDSNPERRLVVGGDNWNSAFSLENLELPDNRDNLIVTFHFYEPFQFTHQGAEWTSGSIEWLGTTFGSEEDFELVNEVFDDVQTWSEENDVPIFLGEFGAYSRADMDSRVLYTETVRIAAEERGFGWCYWEFASGFGIYNQYLDTFNELYPTLIPDNVESDE